jgi:hypothetical protein
MIAKRRLAQVLLTGTTVALVSGVNAGVAAGVNTSWTVTPGGPITLTASSVVLQDNATGVALSCTGSSGSGGLNGGTSPNSILGTITALSFSGCTGGVRNPV